MGLGQLHMSQPLSLELQLSLLMGTNCTSLETLWMPSSLLFAPLHRSAYPLASCAMLSLILFLLYSCCRHGCCAELCSLPSLLVYRETQVFCLCTWVAVVSQSSHEVPAVLSNVTAMGH